MSAWQLEDETLEDDAEQLGSIGLDLAEARHQLGLLSSPPPPLVLDRPCLIGDGIRRIEAAEAAELESLWHDHAATGRFSKFVPASGAASRMFAMLSGIEAASAPHLEELRHRRDALGDPRATELLEVLERLEELPFYQELMAVGSLADSDPGELAARDEYPRLAGAVLGAEGLGYGDRAKGLIPFHLYADGSRTAFEEHLVEGEGYVADARGRGRYHFTVPAAQQGAFEAAAAAYSERGHQISFSTQLASTDTLCLDPGRGPVRGADGRLVLRPGGHGALLSNLARCGGDLAFIKNIDNVLPESGQPLVVAWQRRLGGLLARLQAEAHELHRRLETGDEERVVDVAADFCRTAFGRSPGGDGATDRRAGLLDILERPLRVCGMVPNVGEPGGGPFWVRGDDGEAHPQIVESAQVARDDASQAEIWSRSTHFNPVMLVVALRDPDGEPIELERFVDQRAVFVSEKPLGGRTVRVLERPGLWNGAMAGWNTVFVEVPLEVFGPVKTVLDLLRPQHSGR